MNETIRQVLAELKSKLSALYGERMMAASQDMG